MKVFKWKPFVITSIICLLPILPGLFLWNSLPDRMAIHFDFYGNSDNFASKRFVVFALPALMVILQWICCFANDLNAHKHGASKKFETVAKWIIPCMAVLLQGVTLGYGLGFCVDIRKASAFIVGVVFLVIGNYLPKLDYIKHYDVDKEKARKINRFMGYETVVMGILLIASIFLPPAVTVFCLVLLVPYVLIGAIYGIVTGKK